MQSNDRRPVLDVEIGDLYDLRQPRAIRFTVVPVEEPEPVAANPGAAEKPRAEPAPAPVPGSAAEDSMNGNTVVEKAAAQGPAQPMEAAAAVGGAACGNNPPAMQQPTQGDRVPDIDDLLDDVVKKELLSLFTDVKIE